VGILREELAAEERKRSSDKSRRHTLSAPLDGLLRPCRWVGTRYAVLTMHPQWTVRLTEGNVAPWWYGGASMTTIERNSDDSGPVHDYAWHRTHRTRRGGQWIDVVMLAGWAALVGWVLLRQ
jgi:hypothetical protein